MQHIRQSARWEFRHKIWPLRGYELLTPAHKTVGLSYMIRHCIAVPYRRFGTACGLNSSTLKRETECSYETSANFHKTTRCHISQDDNPSVLRCENR